MSQSPSLRTRLGTFTGVELSPRLHQYRAIPYGRVPRRFARSVPLDEKDYARKEDRTKFGPSSVQPREKVKNDAKSNHLPTEGLPDDWEQSEACLHMTITKPVELTSEGKLPVVVFIHGGAFFVGAGDRPYYNHHHFCEKALDADKPLIFVAINYRLGALGFWAFPEAEDLVPPNNGLHDQKLALRWVKANIADFGGDPENVTVMGQSAGGTSISLCNISDEKEKLWRRSITLSGSIVTMPTLSRDDHSQNFRDQAKELGFDAKLPAKELAEKIIGADVDKIRELGWVGAPCEDSEHVPYVPSIYAQKKRSTVDWLEEQVVGSCTYDGGISYMITSEGDRKDHAKHFIDIVNDGLASLTKLLELYDIKEGMSDDDALECICQFESDIGFLQSSIAQADGAPDKTFFHIFNVGNPFDGPLKGKTTHTLDIVLLLGAFNHLIPDNLKSSVDEYRKKLLAHVYGEQPWDGYDQGKIMVVEDDGCKVKNRAEAVGERIQKLVEIAKEEGGEHGYDKLWKTCRKWLMSYE
ncbi:alpha/beta-hydrolase [Saitoella complicata NRRL Y-17804]|uniref:Carboxylic ester hydrolase n=1 Tax=Saitoella complicata (strain BCRC 22490 / CBS 7301 / JCM 7358 / NBRC 10748 / NRRL Y-17804) TaxID=698492 RepID=A0A0E9NNF5_SAICN|nr:alpha/beta-hydrolase [Saitoella complicata NRRL Y-17804]ODQ51061.1 alpha/beta-hydrolase [Saitoella complicata NRRL Y-17804]GAO51231.1 hypothetical protein G7K_5339-t1 [Saitoella complicata NRRL Y-17804]